MKGSQRKRRVVVVGGGLAGLSAAEAIARAYPERFSVTLLESRRTTGGRAGSFIDRASGESVDYCQHVAMGCCTQLLGLLERTGQLQRWSRYRQLTFLHPHAPVSHFAPTSWLPPPLHLARGLSQLRYLTRRQRKQIRRGLFDLMRAPSHSLRGLPAGVWLRMHGQDENTIAAFWDVILVSALGESTDVVAMSAARKVLVDGFAAARGASDVLVPNHPLATLFGGEATAAIETLGVEIRTSASVRSIAANVATDLPHRSAELVELATGERIAADHVVLATPPAATARLIRQSSLEPHFPAVQSYAELPYAPITGIHLWLDREVTAMPHATLVGMLSQWIFRQPVVTEIRGGEHYYQVVISASHDVRSIGHDALVDRVMADLRRVLPDVANARVLRAKVVTDPHAVLSLRPEVDAIRPPATTPLPWLHLAGDWIQTGWPATMEGAVISGRMAANSLLASEGLPALPHDAGLRPGLLAQWLIRD